MPDDILKRARQIVAENTGETGRCVLALIDLDGSPTASTITPAKADGIREIAFCTGLNGPKTKRIERCGRASVCFSADDYNVTLTGTIEISTDPAVKREMWYDGLRNHFSGHDDPGYCVLRFRTEKYNLLIDWASATGTLRQTEGEKA